MIVFNLFAVLVLIYRWRHRLLTRVEVLLVALWLVHGLLVEAQLLVEFGRVAVDWRYLDPANAILWLEAGWGLSRLWSFPRGRLVIVVALAGFALVNAAMTVKHLFPVGRRARIVRVCREASRQIKADWKGPARDTSVAYAAGEYHSVERPIVEGPSSFRSARRLLGTMAGGRSVNREFFRMEKPDYWLLDEAEAPPAGSEVVSALSYGRHRFVLYRREKGNEH